MTVNELGKNLALIKLTDSPDKEVVSCYISDMLSRVLGGCTSGDAWITVQTSMNMVAVAKMIDAACVILPEGLTAPVNVIGKAVDEELTIFTSEESAYSLAKKIALLL